MKFRTFYLTLFIAFSAACQTNNSPKKVAVAVRDEEITPQNAFSTLFFDSTSMEKYLGSSQIPDSGRFFFRNFYAPRNYQSAWFDSTGMAEQALNFWNMQENYLAYSGDSSIYNPMLQRWIDSVRVSGAGIIPDSLHQSIEWALTYQFFRYASMDYGGDEQLDIQDLAWFIPRKKVDITAMLDSLVKNRGQGISDYTPVNPQFQLLRTELLRYLEIKKQGGWKPLAPGKKKYIQGDTGPEIRQIRHRLFMTRDLLADDSSANFNSELTQAVKHFQQRYGMREDGIVGGITLEELNRPIDFRIKQMLVNLERMRWVPANVTSDFILINIPAYRLYTYENNKMVFRMNVVVGKSQNSTVIFTGKLKYVVFSPYWNVPASIIKKEIIPGIKRNANYLASHNMEWNGGKVRQKPGTKNSLGLVKFLFPNSYDIYLHDTPSKSLFNEDRRAFSHGCIRLSEPEKLADWVLRKNEGWSNTKIEAAMNSGKEKYVTVTNEIQVFIGYFTAFVDGEGTLNFRDDIYGHDKKLAEKMFKK